MKGYRTSDSFWWYELMYLGWFIILSIIFDLKPVNLDATIFRLSFFPVYIIFMTHNQFSEVFFSQFSTETTVQHTKQTLHLWVAALFLFMFS